MVLQASTIIDNHAAVGGGGAIWVGGNLGTLTLTGSTAASNTAASDGGLVWIAGSMSAFQVAEASRCVGERGGQGC